MTHTAVDLTDFGLWMTSPYAVLAELRATDPVYWHEAVPGSPFTSHPFWALTRYEDVQFVSRHPEYFSSASGVISTPLRIGLSEYDSFAMLALDDPKHAWMRALVSKAFTAKMVLGSEGHVRDLTRQIFDAVEPHRHEEIDFVHEISAQLPVRVIGDLLGVPPEDAHFIMEWTDVQTDLVDLEFDFAAGTGESKGATAAVQEMFAYLAKMQKIRADNPTDDLVTRMMHAEIKGERMTLQQQRETFYVILTAGNDTGRNTTTCGAKALADNPDQRAEIVADRTLLRPAVEEMLRFGTVVTHFRRTALQDIEIGDKLIKAGDWVCMFYTAANRDPEVFPDPDRFDIHRSPNEHFAFGAGGPHFCLGAPLARLEMRVLFDELLERFPHYAVTEQPPYAASNVFHGYKSMKVVLDPR